MGKAKKISGFWGLGVGEGEIYRQSTGEIIRAVKKYYILYDNIMVDIWYYAFFQNPSNYKIYVNPNIKISVNRNVSVSVHW